MSYEQTEAVERLIKTLEKLHHRLMVRVGALRAGTSCLPVTALRGARQILADEIIVLDGVIRIREALDLGGADRDSIAQLDVAIGQTRIAAKLVRDLLLQRDGDRLVVQLLELSDHELAWASLDDDEGSWAIDRLKAIASAIT